MRMELNDFSRRCVDMTFTIPTCYADAFLLGVDAFGLDGDALIADYIGHIVSVLSRIGGAIFVENCS